MADNAVMIRPEDGLINAAIEKGLDTEKLEKLIELRNKEIARTAKQDYDRHFAEMQKEFVPVARSKVAKSETGSRLYAFCPLEDILMVNQPIISKHGFSYRWAEETLPNGEKRIWCIVAGYGHEERSFVDIPIVQGNRATNAIQQRGVATSYGKRYSFLSAFGIIVAGEDTDARDLQDQRAQNQREDPQDEGRKVDPEPVGEKPETDAEHSEKLKGLMRELDAELAQILLTKIGDAEAFDAEEKGEARAQRIDIKKVTDRDYARLNSIVEEYRVKLSEKQARAAMDAEPAKPVLLGKPAEGPKVSPGPDHAKQVVEKLFAGLPVGGEEAPEFQTEQEELF